MPDLSTLWTRIDPKEVNDALSSEYLEILEPLLDREPDDVPLKDDRSEKSQIYKMTVLSKLGSMSFRRQLFSCLPKDELTQIAKRLGLDGTSDKEVREQLVQIPWTANAQAEALAEFFDVPHFILDVASESGKRMPTSVNPWFCKYDLSLDPMQPDALREELAGRIPFKPLKSYQAIAHQDVLEALKPNFGKCILNMPTGTGKTRTAMEVVCSYLLEHPAHTVVWIAPSRELLDQATLEFAQLWEYLGDRPIDILRRDSVRSKEVVGDSAFVVTSFQTLLNDSAYYKEVSVGLIVVDEAHMTLADKWSQAVISISRPSEGTRVLGLTATPVRSDSPDTKRLADFYNNVLVQLKYSSEQSVFDYLVEQGILARPVYEGVRGADERLTPQVLAKIVEDHSELPRELIVRLARNGSRNLAITEKLREVLGSPSEQRQVLFFAITVEHSRMITTWLLKNGYSAFHLDATVDAGVRKSCIDAFRDGKIRVLSNYGVLSTGFDVPRVDCLFIARPTTSHVLHSQMVGRGLRGPLIGGTPTCSIVEVEDNIENFADDQRLSFERYVKLWSVQSSIVAP